MHMEFVIVGKASSDKIHVKYNDKIATFHGEIGIDYFLVLANKIEWYPNKKATINENGFLKIASDYVVSGEDPQIEVTATSVYDNTKTGRASVTVL